MREGWKVPETEKEKAIEKLSDWMNCEDPKWSTKAIEILKQIEEVDIKRAELELKRAELEMKKQVKDNEHRLRLLELARHAPVEELAKLASQNGIVSTPVIGEGGRADSTAGVDGSQASG